MIKRREIKNLLIKNTNTGGNELETIQEKVKEEEDVAMSVSGINPN